MQFNIPTLLTLFRVILIPFFVLVFYLPVTWSPFAAALIFCVAAVTDWFDGFLARRWNQSTRFGAFLDPVADKVLVAIAMVLVTEHYHSWWVTLPAAWAACIDAKRITEFASKKGAVPTWRGGGSLGFMGQWFRNAFCARDQRVILTISPLWVVISTSSQPGWAWAKSRRAARS